MMCAGSPTTREQKKNSSQPARMSLLSLSGTKGLKGRLSRFRTRSRGQAVCCSSAITASSLVAVEASNTGTSGIPPANFSDTKVTAQKWLCWARSTLIQGVEAYVHKWRKQRGDFPMGRESIVLPWSPPLSCFWHPVQQRIRSLHVDLGGSCQHKPLETDEHSPERKVIVSSNHFLSFLPLGFCLVSSLLSSLLLFPLIRRISLCLSIRKPPFSQPTFLSFFADTCICFSQTSLFLSSCPKPSSWATPCWSHTGFPLPWLFAFTCFSVPWAYLACLWDELEACLCSFCWGPSLHKQRATKRLEHDSDDHSIRLLVAWHQYSPSGAK